tara:strand:+ start:472 stop:810 length:339 start_codon:yes stop_codon:yes gene_type:complete
VKPILDTLSGMEDSEKIMLQLQEVLSDSQSDIPIPGKVYVYTYIAEKPDFLTDMYPVVQVMGVYNWGWTGMNLHIKKQRNYSIGNNTTPLYLLKPNEVQTVLTLPLMQLYQS